MILFILNEILQQINLNISNINYHRTSGLNDDECTQNDLCGFNQLFYV